ncbi:hypothetical protein HMPREF9539_00238 [Escherichia coli MS 110-3]|nr:hypothetical protein HMPREF9539_00238 [Escherichia coli MS 110-3]
MSVSLAAKGIIPPVQNFYSSRFQKSGEIFNEILITSPDILIRTFTGLFK